MSFVAANLIGIKLANYYPFKDTYLSRGHHTLSQKRLHDGVWGRVRRDPRRAWVGTGGPRVAVPECE